MRESPRRGVRCREGGLWVQSDGGQSAGTCRIGEPGLAAVQTAQPPPGPVLRLAQTRGGQSRGCLRSRRACSTPPSAWQVGVGRAHLTGVQVWAESSFDLRGLSFPGLFICRNHSGFPRLQIHLQEAAPGGAHRGLFYGPGRPCPRACNQFPTLPHPGLIHSLGTKPVTFGRKRSGRGPAGKSCSCLSL